MRRSPPGNNEGFDVTSGSCVARYPPRLISSFSSTVHTEGLHTTKKAVYVNSVTRGGLYIENKYILSLYMFKL